MNAKEALSEIKRLLFENNVKFSLTEGKLVDGTIVSYNLETSEIYVVGQDGVSVPAPVGEHQLESGEIVVVVEEGKISEIKKAEEKPEVEVEVEAEAEPKTDVKEEPKEDAMAKFEQDIAALSEKVEALAKQMEEMKSKNESMSQAVKLSVEVIDTLANQPSDKAIQSPNTFYKEIKSEKAQRFQDLQKAFQKLKTK